MPNPPKYKCPFAGKIKPFEQNPHWFMIECKTEKNTRYNSHVAVAHFPCIANDFIQCLTYQRMLHPEKHHNCFEHDYDGGVCLICGSSTHRDALRSALGISDDQGWDNHDEYESYWGND